MKKLILLISLLAICGSAQAIFVEPGPPTRSSIAQVIHWILAVFGFIFLLAAIIWGKDKQEKLLRHAFYALPTVLILMLIGFVADMVQQDLPERPAVSLFPPPPPK